MKKIVLLCIIFPTIIINSNENKKNSSMLEKIKNMFSKNNTDNTIKKNKKE